LFIYDIEKTQFDPGIWLVSNEIDVIGLDEDGRPFTVLDQKPLSGHIVTDNQRARARLIAAAPAMLEALDCFLYAAWHDRSLWHQYSAVHAREVVRKVVGDGAFLEIPDPPKPTLKERVGRVWWNAGLFVSGLVLVHFVLKYW
jgi:hypothetical protein